MCCLLFNIIYRKILLTLHYFNQWPLLTIYCLPSYFMCHDLWLFYVIQKLISCYKMKQTTFNVYLVHLNNSHFHSLIWKCQLWNYYWILNINGTIESISLNIALIVGGLTEDWIQLICCGRVDSFCYCFL